MKLSKKVKLFPIFLLAILIFFAFFLFSKNNHCQNKFATVYLINNKNYCLLTANNQGEWERGLMFYKSKQELKSVDGMIFVFPDKQMRSFWNKDTYLDLDLYWMNDEKVVGKSFLPSILKSKETVTIKSSEKVNKVVELIK